MVCLLARRLLGVLRVYTFIVVAMIPATIGVLLTFAVAYAVAPHVLEEWVAPVMDALSWILVATVFLVVSTVLVRIVSDRAEKVGG